MFWSFGDQSSSRLSDREFFLTFSAACFGFLSAIEINFHLMLSCLDLVFPPVMSPLFTFCCLFCPSIPSDGSYVSLCLVTLAPTPLFRDWNDAHLGKEWSPNCVSIRCLLIVWRGNLNQCDGTQLTTINRKQKASWVWCDVKSAKLLKCPTCKCRLLLAVLCLYSQEVVLKCD